MERDPHVRAVIERAMAMGKVVCIQDPDATRDRDVAALHIDADFTDDGSLRRCLDAADAPAVLVRADRYVFGIGQPSELVEGYLEASARAQLPGSQP
jgi:hypothetical protein